MAAITSAGLGSGLDIESLVSKLMAVEQQPISKLKTQESSYNTKLSSWGQVSNALASFQVAAEALNTRSKFAAFSSSIADTTVASSSVSSSAVAGNYSLEVTQLADVQKVKTAGYASMTTAITADTLPKTLSLEIGTTDTGIFTADSAKTKSITIDSSNNTLEGMRDAINNAKAGVTATIVNDGGSSPYRLVLTSDKTGSSSSFKLSGLTDFSYNPATGTGTGVSKIQDAGDAKFKIDGISISKSSNVVTDAIQGATLTLKKTNENTPTTLSVAADTASITQKLSTFVSAYNTLNSVIKVQTSYDASTKKAGALNGEATTRGIQTQLRGILTSSVGNLRLSDVGIAFQKDGSLALDSSKFQKALADTTKDVAGLFAKDGSSLGIASQIGTRAASMLAADGLLSSRTSGIKKSVAQLDKQMDVLSDRLASIEKRYRAQFTALDTHVSSMNATSSYLTQQIAALNKSSN